MLIITLFNILYIINIPAKKVPSFFCYNASRKKRKEATMGFFGNNADLIRVIYRAEMTAEAIDTSVNEILLNYKTDLSDLNHTKNKDTIQKLGVIASRLQNAESRDRVYKGILPDDVIAFISQAEVIGGIKSSDIIREYAPIKELGEKSLSKIKKKLYFPFGIFLVAVFMFNFLVGEFIPIANAGTIYFSDTAKFVMNNYVYINLAYGGIFGFLFLAIPKKVPLISKVFSEIEGMLALSTIIIFHKLSYSASEMIPLLVTRFKLQKMNPRNREIKGLTAMLYQANYLSDLQASDIRNSGSVTGQLGSVLARVFNEKRESVELLDEILQEAVKNITVLLIAFPIMMMLVVLGALFTGVMALI